MTTTEKPTREQIEAMEAGPELNAMAAQVVMNDSGPWHHDIDGTAGDTFYDICSRCSLEPKNEGTLRDSDDRPLKECPVPPNYSKNISAAMELIDKLRGDLFDVHIDLWDLSRGKVSVMIESSNHSPQYRATAPTAALAITKAAIIASISKG